jgi:hypothetical protein
MATSVDILEQVPVDELLIPLTTEDDEARRQSDFVRQLRDRHWTMLWLSLAIVACVLLLQVGETGIVAPDWFPKIALPALCASRVWFGVQCPGCGLTRSLIALASGDLAASVEYHRVGWVLAVAVLLQFPYRVLALRELRTRVVERSWPTWFGWALIATLIGSWLGKVTALF